MNFRTGKRHKVQESGKSKNILKLAAKLQHFIDTAKASKRDLKEIDNQISFVALDQGRKILQLLEQLKERTPKVKGSDSLEQTCTDWKNWLTELDSKKVLGYSDVGVENGESRSAILESAIDADTDMFRMLSAFSTSLASLIKKLSYEVPNYKEIQSDSQEILDAYNTRQKIVSKLQS